MNSIELLIHKATKKPAIGPAPVRSETPNVPPHIEALLDLALEDGTIRSFADPAQADGSCGLSVDVFLDIVEQVAPEVEAHEVHYQAGNPEPMPPWAIPVLGYAQAPHPWYLKGCRWDGHCVALVDGWIVDWTARQFDPNAPFPPRLPLFEVPHGRLRKHRLKDGSPPAPRRKGVMDNLASLKTQNPALFNVVETELLQRQIEVESPDGLKVVAAVVAREALVEELAMWTTDPVYSKFPVGSQGYDRVSALKDKLLKQIVEQEALLANFGLV